MKWRHLRPWPWWREGRAAMTTKAMAAHGPSDNKRLQPHVWDELVAGDPPNREFPMQTLPRQAILVKPSAPRCRERPSKRTLRGDEVSISWQWRRHPYGCGDRERGSNEERGVIECRKIKWYNYLLSTQGPHSLPSSHYTLSLPLVMQGGLFGNIKKN